jgi:hypothetical protein
MRYDRCAHTFFAAITLAAVFAAITLAAVFTFWLGQ